MTLPASTITSVPLSCLVLGSHQPRRRFDPDAIESLAASLRQRGLLQPLVVRPLEGELFEIVAGERRYFAAKAANLHQVPVVVLALGDTDTLEVSLLENLHRQNLSEIEETEGILRFLGLRLALSSEAVASLLYRMDNEAKGRVTQSVLGNAQGQLVLETFARLGLMGWQSFVATRLPLLKLPDDLLEALSAGKISAAQARLLARVKEAPARFALLHQLQNEALTLPQLRQRTQPNREDADPSWLPVLRQLRARLSLGDAALQARALGLLEELERLLSDGPA